MNFCCQRKYCSDESIWRLFKGYITKIILLSSQYCQKLTQILIHEFELCFQITETFLYFTQQI